MKILKVEIFSPNLEKLREVEFRDKGLSIIYGDVEKPKSENETSNSIGKTVLLKIVNVILGTKNSGKDTIKGLEGFIIKAKVKKDAVKYDVEITIGNSKKYYIDGINYTLTKYKEKFNINRSFYNKQTMLDKRKGLLSSIAKKPNKDDISVILKLLYLENVESIFMKIKKMQNEIELINKYNNNFKDDISCLEREQFNNEMKKKQVDEELDVLNERIKTLKLADNISTIAQKRAALDQNIKYKNEKLRVNNIRISKYEQIINDSKANTISLMDVEKIYNNAKVEIPILLKKNLSDVEKFYKNLLDDKNDLYSKQVSELKTSNKKISEELEVEQQELDRLSEIISENDTVREAIKIYDLKAKEKMDVESRISEVNAKLTQINNSKNLKSEIDSLLVELEESFENSKLKINNYREYIYNLVKQIYGDDRNPYLNISVTNTNHKYQAMPVNIDLTFDGDTGEGLMSAKFLLFDYLIMNYTKEVDFLIEDSSCFEAIDRRQIKNILQEGIKISERNDKQLIVSLNKYSLEDVKGIEDYIVLPLNENNTLLNIKF